MPGPNDDEVEVARGYNVPKYGEVPEGATERGVNPPPQFPADPETLSEKAVPEKDEDE